MVTIVLEFETVEEAQLLNDLAMYGMARLVPPPGASMVPDGWLDKKVREKEAAVRAALDADPSLSFQLADRMSRFLDAIEFVRNTTRLAQGRKD